MFYFLNLLALFHTSKLKDDSESSLTSNQFAISNKSRFGGTPRRILKSQYKHFSLKFVLRSIRPPTLRRRPPRLASFVISRRLYSIFIRPGNSSSYRAFHRFGQAKFAYGGPVLGSSQFSPLPQLAQKMTLASKVVKFDSEIIISFC